jgi:hypothetical protein
MSENDVGKLCKQKNKTIIYVGKKPLTSKVAVCVLGVGLCIISRNETIKYLLISIFHMLGREILGSVYENTVAQ